MAVERKTSQIVVVIEPTYYDLVKKVDRGNTSEWIRLLIVNELIRLELLTAKEILKLHGLTMSEVEGEQGRVDDSSRHVPETS